MRIVDGNTIETECDSCTLTFTTGRGEDGEPDEILCSECKQTWEELRAELLKERDRVWFETFLSFPFKQLPAPTQIFDDLDWAEKQAEELRAWVEHQDLMDAADQAAYYSPHFGEDE